MLPLKKQNVKLTRKKLIKHLKLLSLMISIIDILHTMDTETSNLHVAWAHDLPGASPLSFPAFFLSTTSFSFSSCSNFHFFTMSSWTCILPLVLEESRGGRCELLKVESWRHYFKCLTDVRQVLCLVTQSNRGENLSSLS